MSAADPRTSVLRLLVVDDEREIREILAEFLAQRGYEVHAVETGRQALDLCARKDLDFAAALVDWTLPGIEGSDVMVQIRDLQPGCHIFAITGHAGQVVSASAVGGLVEEVFRKPFSLRQVLARVEECLRRGPPGRP